MKSKDQLEDVLEQLRKENAALENKLNTILNFTPDIQYRMNLETGKFDYISAEVGRILGLNPKQLIDMGPEKLIDAHTHPDDIEKTGLYWQSFPFMEDADQKHHSIQYRWQGVDGNYYWLKDTHILVKENEYPKYIVGSVKDITEKVASDNALKESEIKYYQLFNTPNDMILIHGYTNDNIPDHFIEANDASISVLGYSREELLKMSIVDIIHKDDRSKIAAETEKLKKNEKCLFELTFVTKSGDYIPVEIHTRIFQLGGKNTAFSICRDITERKKIENNLKITQFGIDHSQIAVFQVDDNGQIYYVNDQACQDLGYTSDELYQMKIWEVDAHLTQEQWKNHRKQTRNKRFSNIITNHRRKDGTIFPVEVAIDFIKFDNQSYSISFAKDITRQKQYEEELLKFKTAVDSSTNAVGMSTPEGKHFYQNKTFNELFGDIINTPPQKLYVDNHKGQEVFSSIMSGNAWAGEVQMYGKNREILDIILHAYPIKDISGKITALVGLHGDITKQKIREKEYEKLVDNMNDMTFVIDMNGIFIQANETACHILGYSRNELLSKGPHDISLFSSIEEIKNLIEQLKNKHKKVLETIIRKKNKELIPVEISSNMITYHGRPAILSIVRDLSSRIQTEQQLRLLEFGIDNSQIAAYQIDEQARIRYVNAHASKSLGYSKAELLKMSITDIDPVFNMKQWEKHCSGKRDGDSITLETFHQRKDGTKYPVEIFVNYLKYNNELLSFSFAKDISERKQAETIVAENQKRLTFAAQIAKLGYWEYDAKTDLFSFNDEFYAVYHTTAEKIGGYTMKPRQYAEAFIPEENRQIIANEMSKALETDDPDFSHYLEHPIIYADGGTGYIAVHYFILKDDKGNTIKTFGVNQDITESKRLELERENMIQELRDKNDELERFTYTVSHDLKSPMITIQGFSGLIKQDIKSKRYNDVENSVNRITEAADQMDQLLKDLLELSRIGRVVNPSVMIGIDSIVQNTLSLLEGRLKKNNIQVTVKKNMPQVFADKVRMQEVMNNLIDNAIKFTSETENPNIDIGFIQAGNMFEFYVKDNGIGIDSKYHQRIFGLFEQLNKNYEGTGVGLSLVKRIIEYHDGSIRVESQGENQGTTFYFSLPVPENNTNDKE